MKILGIDPGNKGAFFVLENGKPVDDFVMPLIDIHVTKKKTKHEFDLPKIEEYLLKTKPEHVFLEKAQAMSKTGEAQGAVSMFNYGVGYGMLRGMLIVLKIPYTLVHPKTWSAKVLRDMPKGDTKANALVIAQRLFPTWNFIATERSSKPHEGLIDAALIAWYGFISFHEVKQENLYDSVKIKPEDILLGEIE